MPSSSRRLRRMRGGRDHGSGVRAAWPGIDAKAYEISTTAKGTGLSAPRRESDTPDGPVPHRAVTEWRDNQTQSGALPWQYPRGQDRYWGLAKMEAWSKPVLVRRIGGAADLFVDLIGLAERRIRITRERIWDIPVGNGCELLFSLAALSAKSLID